MDDLAGVKICKGLVEISDGTYIKLNDEVYFFEYDPDDGYRSHCRYVGVVPEAKYAEYEFNLEYTPLEVLVVEFDDSFRGIQVFGSPDICGKRNKPFITLGTSNTDDYYPWFTSEYDSEEATEVKKKQDEFIAEMILLDKAHKLLGMDDV